MLPAPPRVRDVQLRPRREDPEPTGSHPRDGGDGLEGLVKYVPHEPRPMPGWWPLAVLLVLFVVAWALVFALFKVVF